MVPISFQFLQKRRIRPPTGSARFSFANLSNSQRAASQQVGAQNQCFVMGLSFGFGQPFERKEVRWEGEREVNCNLTPALTCLSHVGCRLRFSPKLWVCCRTDVDFVFCGTFGL